MAKKLMAGVPADAMEVVVDGVRLAIAREGAGPPIVCLSAIAHGGGDFGPMVERLKDRFEVIRVDWPGHGRSGDDSHPVSPGRYAELILGLLDQLGVVQPLLVGCSIGGAVAILIAAQRPVSGLVLCDSAGLVEVDATVAKVCRAFSRIFAAGERGAWWFGAAYAAYYRLLVLPSPAAAGQRRRIVACGREMAGVLRQAWEGFGRPQADIRRTAAELEVPIWCAWARGDRVIPLSRCEPAIAAMRDATLTTYRGGHAAFLEQPDAFVRDFLKFVGRTSSRATTQGAARRPQPGSRPLAATSAT